MEDDEIGVEVVPAPVVYELYRCDKGHEQRGSGETAATNKHTGRRVTTGAVCMECQLTAIGELYPTRKVPE